MPFGSPPYVNQLSAGCRRAGSNLVQRRFISCWPNSQAGTPSSGEGQWQAISRNHLRSMRRPKLDLQHPSRQSRTSIRKPPKPMRSLISQCPIRTMICSGGRGGQPCLFLSDRLQPLARKGVTPVIVATQAAPILTPQTPRSMPPGNGAGKCPTGRLGRRRPRAIRSESLARHLSKQSG